MRHHIEADEAGGISSISCGDLQMEKGYKK